MVSDFSWWWCDSGANGSCDDKLVDNDVSDDNGDEYVTAGDDKDDDETTDNGGTLFNEDRCCDTGIKSLGKEWGIKLWGVDGVCEDGRCWVTGGGGGVLEWRCGCCCWSCCCFCCVGGDAGFSDCTCDCGSTLTFASTSGTTSCVTAGGLVATVALKSVVSTTDLGVLGCDEELRSSCKISKQSC